jgi:FYVE zinc finger/Zinc finger, C3HC4 type (RING finger)
MVKQSADNSWANFEGSGKPSFCLQVDQTTRSNKGRPKGDSLSTSRWMTAPIDSEDLLPLAPPGFIESPRCGSAASRTRFMTDVPVKSARRPETISTFSRKKSSDPSHATKTMEQSTRTVSTSTADSNSDSERGREKLVLGSPRALRVPKHFFEENPQTSRRSSKLAASQPEASAESFHAFTSTNHESFRISNHEQDTECRNPVESVRGRSNTRDHVSRDVGVEKISSKSRGRSTSRAKLPPPIEVVRMRSRSSSQTRLVHSTEGHITPRRRSSSRSQYPPTTPSSYTKNRHRSRSASLTRLPNEPRSSSPAKRPHRRPPSTYRTRQELRDATLVVNGGRATASEGDANSVRSSTGWNSVPEPGSTGELAGTSLPLLENTNNTNKIGLRERLFGNDVDGSSSNRLSAGVSGSEIRPRVLLAATVYHNKATNFWVATINTNQRGVAKNPERANKYLKAFSFATEQEARESAIVNAPPKMIPFNESPACFCCKGKFAVFRRAGHCRNCGVCVCNSCSVTWSSKLIPETYNLKNEANVKVCRSCNTLSLAFKRSLLQGDFDEAVALYRTGNINLRTPFPLSNKKDESMHPIHCAAEGGNIQILRWLIDDHFCPIKVHITSKKISNTTAMADSPIRTSKGRTVLSIAIESLKVEMMRYLVVELGISIYECKDLRPTLSALEAALSALPCSVGIRNETVPQTVPTGVARWDNATFDDDCSEPSSLGVDDEAKYLDETKSRASGSRNGGGDQGGQQVCVICFDRKINCVGTPCGHAVSCLECSGSLKLCPICNERSNFIKIYRP